MQVDIDRETIQESVRNSNVVSVVRLASMLGEQHAWIQRCDACIVSSLHRGCVSDGVGTMVAMHACSSLSKLWHC